MYRTQQIKKEIEEKTRELEDLRDLESRGNLSATDRQRADQLMSEIRELERQIPVKEPPDDILNRNIYSKNTKPR